MPERAPIDTQLLAIPESAGSALYGMLDVLRTCGMSWRELAGNDRGPQAMQVRIVAQTDEPFRCGYGIPIEPHLAIGPANVPEVLVIPDFWLRLDDPLSDRYDALKTWLVHCWSRGTSIYAACSGSVLLAAAGLLDGRPATSHWAYAELFRRRFPKVAFNPSPNLCFSDHAGRLVTAGGATTWHDLALHIIARQVSPGEAITTAKFFLMKWHAEGQLPYINRVCQRPHADRAVRRAEDWLAKHYTTPDPVAGVVEAVGIPERSLKRRFSQATGTTVIAYAQNLRVEAAKQALEMTAKPLEEIAAEVGYENVAFFRRLFKRCTGLGPSEYRRLFEPLLTMHVAAEQAASGR
ncbi:MAG: helix-turn-helix domain-containing protein [Pseudomonadota bacterium]